MLRQVLFAEEDAQFSDSPQQQHYDIGPVNDELYPNQWLPENELPGWRRVSLSTMCHEKENPNLTA